jgi:hypothetical protein
LVHPRLFAPYAQRQAWWGGVGWGVVWGLGELRPGALEMAGLSHSGSVGI